MAGPVIYADPYMIIPFRTYENSYPPYSAGIVKTNPVIITQLSGTTSLAGLSKDVSYLAYNQMRLSYQINVLDAKVAKMEPLVITQSISFLIGAFVAIAFILAVVRSRL